MAKRHGSGIYLGTTRRQRNQGIRNGWIAAVLVVLVLVLSLFFLSWLLKETDGEKDSVPGTPDTEAVTDPAEAPISAETTEPLPETEPPAVSSAADTEAARVPSVPGMTVTGTPHKMLDYTDQWVVMIDPGHGFDDIGTSSELLGDTNEATITLDVALRMRSVLAEAGVTVLLTHEDSTVPGRISAADGGEPPKNNLVLLTPEDRAALANGQDIDLFVSIHCDSIPGREQVSGMRVYYHEMPDVSSERNAGAQALSSRLAAAFSAVTPEPAPMVKSMQAEDAYYVIRKIAAPSALCEIGFVTNPADAEHLLDAGWREAAAKALADGVLWYIEDAKNGKN